MSYQRISGNIIVNLSYSLRLYITAFAVVFQGVRRNILRNSKKFFRTDIIKYRSQNPILENLESVNQLIINSHAETFPVIQCYFRLVYILNACKQLFWAINDIDNTLPTKNETNKFRIIIGLLPICGKHLEKTLLIKFFNTWWKTICLKSKSVRLHVCQFLYTSTYFNYHKCLFCFQSLISG